MRIVPVRLFIVLAIGLAVFTPLGAVRAHGVELTYALMPVMALRVDLTARDAAGEPLTKAVVDVYAPGQDEAWFSTELGKTGALSLIPDIQQPGIWTFDIHKGDGGAALHLPLAFGTDYARVAAGETVTAEAHGIALSYALTEIPTVAIALDASFESGEAMSGAQVTVYAPDNAKTPWLIGTCDEVGHFEFIADSANTGVWDIQVRLAGHGEWINIELTADAVQVSATDDAIGGRSKLSLSEGVSSSVESSGGYTTGQIVLMSASVVWGMIGTALYIARRRDTSSHQETE